MLKNTQELRDALNIDGPQKVFVLSAITHSTTSYFEHLRRQWKDENDIERLKRWEANSMQSKHDQRVRLVSQFISDLGIRATYILHSYINDLSRR